MKIERTYPLKCKNGCGGKEAIYKGTDYSFGLDDYPDEMVKMFKNTHNLICIYCGSDYKMKTSEIPDGVDSEDDLIIGKAYPVKCKSDGCDTSKGMRYDGAHLKTPREEIPDGADIEDFVQENLSCLKCKGSFVYSPKDLPENLKPIDG